MLPFHQGRNLINKTIWVLERESKSIHHSRIRFDLELVYPHHVAKKKELGYIAAVVKCYHAGILMVIKVISKKLIKMTYLRDTPVLLFSEYHCESYLFIWIF